MIPAKKKSCRTSVEETTVGSVTEDLDEAVFLKIDAGQMNGKRSTNTANA